MSPAVRKLLAKRFMGLAGSSDYVDWAVSELVAGSDTMNLRILGGLPKPPYWPEVELYFTRSLADLGYTLPERDAYLQEYARHVARQIISGEIEPFEGLHEIYKTWQALDYSIDLTRWVYLGDGLDPDTYRQLGEDELEAAVRREAEALAHDTRSP